MPVSLDLPKDRLNIIKLSDWLEINALLDRDCSSSIEDLTSELKVGYESKPVKDIPTDVSSELRRRVHKVGNAYPFSFNGRLISVKDAESYKDQWAYLFCLLVSYIGLDRGAKELKVWKVRDMTKVFEGICTLVARKFLSSDKMEASSLQFGFPRSTWKREHRSFKKALDFLRAEICEGSVKINPTANGRKDAGLDVIAWRAFPDKRMSKLFLLGQCAAGTDVRKKKRELKEFFQYYTLEVGIICSFFMPHEVDDTDWFDFYTPDVGIAFDRSRISFYAQEWDGTGFEGQLQTILNRLRAYRKAL
jgi:hypothetical protein